MKYVYTVTLYDDIGTEPIITVFDNPEAAEKCYEWFEGDYRVCLDKVPVYKQFHTGEE